MRLVTKQLATMEDLVAGQGQVSQDRGGTTYILGKIDQAYAVLTEDELKALDTTFFSYAFFNGVFYRWDALNDTGLKPFQGFGSWLVSSSGNKAKFIISLTSGQLIVNFPGADASKLAIHIDGQFITDYAPGADVSKIVLAYSWPAGTKCVGV